MSLKLLVREIQDSPVDVAKWLQTVVKKQQVDIRVEYV